MPSPQLSLVLACYNEAPILVRCVGEIVAALEGSGVTYELIFVEDASLDRTRALIGDLVERYGDRVVMQTLFHERNLGRGGSVRDGLLKSRGEIAGFIDVDLEVHPRSIPACLAEIRRGADVAIARRVYDFRWRSLDRYLMSKGYALMVRRLLGDLGVSDTEAGFKFFRSTTLRPILAQSRDNGWFWDTEIMALARLAGLSVVEVPCPYVRRFDKPSSVRPARDSLASLIKLVRFSARLRRLRAGASVNVAGRVT
jgi:glycosyltransferase involved in cell wall biosynthesis